MVSGRVLVYYGEGRGKTTAAYGSGLRLANQGKTVYIIQFLKDRDLVENPFFKRLEPEIKFFRFEKNEKNYDSLTEEEQKEERINMRNGINYAKKVLQTGECSVLVLDEVLGILDNGVISFDELKAVVEVCDADQTVVLTGRTLNEKVRELATEVYDIRSEK